jgi:predicted enzyme related to lactoylglutathione lyase
VSLRIEVFPTRLGPTVDFYTGVLGFALVRSEGTDAEGYVALRRGQVQLGVAARSGHRADLAHRRPPTGVELVLEVDDVAEELRRVRAGGWPVEEQLSLRPWGLRDFRLLDPSGYYLRITEREPSEQRPGPTADPPAHPRVPLLRAVDAVTVAVPDLDAGLRFYRDQLGHDLLWRDDAQGQAGLRLPDSDAELVLSTDQGYAPNWLVTSVSEAVQALVAAGGRVLHPPTPIPVGWLAVVADPFGNALVLLDLSTGRYTTDEAGRVTSVQPPG